MYINKQTKKYPISESEIRFANTNISFAIPFNAPEDYAWVFPSPIPEFNSVIQRVIEIAPELTDKGHWEQRWEVVSRFEEYTDDVGITHTIEEQESVALLQHEKERTQKIQQEIVQYTQNRLDDFAKTRNYDGILSACTYATSTIAKFKTEGQYCIEARDATWAKLYEILDDVQAETRPEPNSFADIESDLPELRWPNT